PIDVRADVYAGGAMLFHAVTGRMPFEAGDGAGVLSASVSEDPPRPRSWRAGRLDRGVGGVDGWNPRCRRAGGARVVRQGAFSRTADRTANWGYDRHV